MKTFRTFALASILAVSGCAGFGAGVRHAVTGEVSAEADKAKSGYDYGVLLGNILVAAFGYVTRHVQDKVLPKKDLPPEPEKK